MGIPRLTSLLAPHYTSEALGCNNQTCGEYRKHMSIVIDGPSLAYYIYNALRLVEGVPKTPFGQPTYKALGDTALHFLADVEKAGAEVVAIYFDGHLPTYKRETRLARLNASLRQLLQFRSAYPRGILRKHCADTLDDAFSLLHLTSLPNFAPTAAHSPQLPAPPFLVPAVLDAIRTDPKYLPLLHVVPWEADTWCAAQVKQRGSNCVVLSSDSDLVAHDLGHGGVAWFRDLHYADCQCSVQSEDCGNIPTKLIAQIARPIGISKSLSLPKETASRPRGMLRLAFEVQQDPHCSFGQATNRAKDLDSIWNPERVTAFRNFALEYAALDFTDGVDFLPLKNLDPRLAEVVNSINDMQKRVRTPKNGRGSRVDGSDHGGTVDHDNKLKENHAIFVYLPFLISDPMRASPWNPSEGFRMLVYTLLASNSFPASPEDQTNGLPLLFEEFTLRGLRISSNQLETLTSVARNEKTDDLISLIQNGKDTFRQLNAVAMGQTRFSDLNLWWIIALNALRAWHEDSLRARIAESVILEVLSPSVYPVGAPRNSKGRSKKMMAREKKASQSSMVAWNAVQLIAEVQGWLYSLRMLKQTARLARGTNFSPETAAEKLLMKLNDLLDDLPDISVLMNGPAMEEQSMLLENRDAILSFVIGTTDEGKAEDVALDE